MPLADQQEELSDPGEVPALDWVDVALIDADPLFQRPLDQARVGAILKAFTWKSFGAIVVSPRADGRYSVTDGQHRAEAAKLHPKVTHVPAIIVQADDLPDEAGIFVAINKNRKNVSALELFFAQLAADEEAALDIFHTCSRAGVDIAKYPHADLKPKQTIAVSAIGALIAKRGVVKAREVLEVTAGGQFAPITAAQIKAAEALLHEPEFSLHVAVDDVKLAVSSIGNSLDGEAKRFAATHCCPLWKGLASVWFQKCRKRRASGAQTSKADRIETAGFHPEPVAEHGSEGVNLSRAFPAAQRRFIQGAAQPRNVTGAICGDPPAGRSALDQRGRA